MDNFKLGDIQLEPVKVDYFLNKNDYFYNNISIDAIRKLYIIILNVLQLTTLTRDIIDDKKIDFIFKYVNYILSGVRYIKEIYKEVIDNINNQLKNNIKENTIMRGLIDTLKKNLNDIKVDNTHKIITGENKNEYDKRIEQLEEENRTLKNRVEKLEEENKTLKEKNKILEKENKTLKNRIKKLEEDNNILTTRVKKLEEMEKKLIIRQIILTIEMCICKKIFPNDELISLKELDTELRFRKLEQKDITNELKLKDTILKDINYNDLKSTINYMKQIGNEAAHMFKISVDELNSLIDNDSDISSDKKNNMKKMVNILVNYFEQPTDNILKNYLI